MRQSSDTVGALAAALAKAQAELTNPEKSQVATLPAERGLQERRFRYAPLAGGLDIVRKTLGKHEIATLQSTSVDRDSGIIRLTTTLAHASGEWIASDWPVCRLADLPAPHRMGAALTYARRYSLFALVGIAGEDDLDAPDLPLQTEPVQAPTTTMAQTMGHVASPPLSPGGRRKTGKSVSSSPSLDPAASAQQKDQLIVELAALSTLDEAAAWAKRILPVKNIMTSEHAREVETALQTRLSSFDDVLDRRPAREKHNSILPQESAPNGNVERVASPVAGPRRRNKAHLKFVASQPCLACGRRPSDPHHLRFAQARALGRKVSDEFTVPLCRMHHREVHRTGDEHAWWSALGGDIDPLQIAKNLWERSKSGGAETPAS
jgi:hypothetical protein